MITINLEKELIKQNKKLVTPQELMKIKEYDKYAHIANNDILNRIGINKSIKSGEFIKSEINKKKEETLKFNQERVFHKSQIKSICEKYYLRFLPTRYYEGTVDEQLPIKISNFEIAHEIQCNTDNMYIVAPKESFNLQERPKDPLVFYRINDEYYYLIHKWGNDLNIFRRLNSFFSNPWYTFFSGLTLLLLIMFIFLFISESISVFVFSFTICYTITSLIFNFDGDCALRIFKKNEWDSIYID